MTVSQIDSENLFLKRFESTVTGHLSFFDRIIIRGLIRPLSRVEGMASWLNWKHVLLKDFGPFVERQSQRLKEHARTLAEAAKRPHIHLTSSKGSKEAIAESLRARDRIDEGLVCVLRAVEPCMSYGIHRNPQTKKLELRRMERKCLFLYFYYVDREFGLMHIRLQTWFPFDIQIWINGREWLARKLDRAGIAYTRRDNCFTSLGDPQRAQAIADGLLDTNLKSIFNIFARRVNPLLRSLLRGTPYYWTFRQGEYATDVMFRSTRDLDAIFPHLVDHAVHTFQCEDVLRFMGYIQPGHFKGKVRTDLKHRWEGIRVLHGVHENSLKMYNKQGSVLRIETTINNPRRFKAYRWTVRDGRRTRAWLPLRKAIADIRRRVEISCAANARYLNALAAVPDRQPACRILDPVTQAATVSTQRYRPLRPIEPEEARRFAGLLRGDHLLNGFRNVDLRLHLFPRQASDAQTRKAQSQAISRYFRLLRAHGLIRKLTGTSRYQVTKRGIEVMSTALRVRNMDLALVKQTA